MTYTPEELERLHYIAGNVQLASMYGEIEDGQFVIEGLEDELDQAKSDVASFTKWEERNGPASEYYDFFHGCFERLAGHYPCPSVTSDYDKSIIFDAIERGG